MEAFNAGYELGLNWVGPNGDGSMGALSYGFVRERAEMHAAGVRFSELGYVTDKEARAADAFMRGFYLGLSARGQKD